MSRDPIRGAQQPCPVAPRQLSEWSRDADQTTRSPTPPSRPVQDQPTMALEQVELQHHLPDTALCMCPLPQLAGLVSLPLALAQLFCGLHCFQIQAVPSVHPISL